MRVAVAVALALAARAGALDNGLGLTPQMGYSTWNDFRCDGLTADAVKRIADRIVELGLATLGYRYLNIDDCWSRELSPEGLLVEDPLAFPEGIAALVDYVHERGLLFGIYTCRGTRTCALRPGSKGLERHHAAQFAQWGVDYVKEDSCFASNEHEQAFSEYAAMRDALNSTGHPLFFSLCGWNTWYAPRGAQLANSWRIAPDCDEWANVYVAVRTNEALARFAGPGGWNDPDMLVGSHPDAAVQLTPRQVQTQFNLWAVMASPLLIGSSILRMPGSDLATYSNEEVIRINQDPLGVQGVPVWSSCPPFAPRDNWWMAPWTMPQDVARMWTRLLSTCLVAAAALIALLARALRFTRGAAPAVHGAHDPILLAPVATDGSTLADKAPSPALPRARAAIWRYCVSRGCLAAMLVLLALLSLPALAMLVAIHAMKPRAEPCQQVWVRPLEGGAAAICLVNFAPDVARIVCDAACLDQAGFPLGVHVRDVVARRDMGPVQSLDMDVPGDGGSFLFRVSPRD
ncbi:hypothetical protein KFE25_008986 [Diacronema lutheri]|uniref:Alpha-galactosidase n=1 Tax=Diacronema lutheri TaxID=2081491 RepID=A0A7R9YKR5_DIALT|nr:hypothetical protein KFE25_008986 [Diacronema lutheri]|mmetsp:Transcript_203/g.666  ORF Transcript_203/g.666 Transcript_203/m.666 type:complete len:517 (+) Transcript_203:40-1590(+)